MIGSSNHNRRLLVAAFALLVLVNLCLSPGGSDKQAGWRAQAQSAGPGRILSSSGTGVGGLIAFNTDGSNLINLTANTFDQTGCTNDVQSKSTHPSVAQNGRIAFASTRDGSSRFRIFVSEGDGTGLRQLTTSAGAVLDNGEVVHDFNPVISPDGSKVAFISRRNAPAQNRSIQNIFLVNTDGSGGVQQVTFPQTQAGDTLPRSTIASAVWSPDGARLAFRGQRLAPTGNPPVIAFHLVVSTIQPNGSNEGVEGKTLASFISQQK